MKEYSCCCGEIVYAGYDLKDDSYYQEQYLWGEKTRYEISYMEPSGDATSFENIDYMIRKAIVTSIKEQL